MAIQLTIYRRYFRDSRCYRSAPMQPVTGVQVHSTGANNPWLRRYVQPDDGRIGVNANGNSHNSPSGTVCASAYIGKQSDGTVAVYQALPWEQRCWLSGSGPKGNANKLGYIGFEICEDAKTDASYFYAALDQAAMLTAHLCLTFGLDPLQDVRDHQELHDLGLASNHGDITHWLRLHGETMDTFRGAVVNYMAAGVEADYIDCDEVNIMYEAKAVCPGAYLNLRSGPAKTYASLAPIPQGDTVQVLGDNGDWYYVEYHGITGWAMAQYLERLPEEKLETDDRGTDGGPPDTVAIDRLKLLEVETCLKNALNIIQAAKEKGG